MNYPNNRAKTLTPFILFVLIVSLLNAVIVQPVSASVCYATANGPWSSASTWSCGHTPDQTDYVYIQNGYSVRVDNTAMVGYVQVSSGSTLTLDSVLVVYYGLDAYGYMPGNNEVRASFSRSTSYGIRSEQNSINLGIGTWVDGSGSVTLYGKFNNISMEDVPYTINVYNNADISGQITISNPRVSFHNYSTITGRILNSGSFYNSGSYQNSLYDSYSGSFTQNTGTMSGTIYNRSTFNNYGNVNAVINDGSGTFNYYGGILGSEFTNWSTGSILNIYSTLQLKSKIKNQNGATINLNNYKIYCYAGYSCYWEDYNPPSFNEIEAPGYFATIYTGSGSPTFTANTIYTNNTFYIAPGLNATIGSLTVDTGGNFYISGSTYTVGTITNYGFLSGNGSYDTLNVTNLNDYGSISNLGSLNLAVNGSGNINSSYNIKSFTKLNGGTLTFKSGSTFYPYSSLNLNGSGSELYLRSSNPGTQWFINPPGTKTIAWVDVQDSYSLSSIDVRNTGSIDSGNNINWVLEPYITNTTVPASNTYVGNDVLTFSLTWNKPIIIQGIPRLTLTIGSNVRYATYDAASSTSTSSVFKYIVAKNDFTSNGIILSNVVDPNGGSITDSGSVAARLSLPTTTT